jgi:hypothetical protein
MLKESAVSNPPCWVQYFPKCFEHLAKHLGPLYSLDIQVFSEHKCQILSNLQELATETTALSQNPPSVRPVVDIAC